MKTETEIIRALEILKVQKSAYDKALKDTETPFAHSEILDRIYITKGKIISLCWVLNIDVKTLETAGFTLN